MKQPFEENQYSCPTSSNAPVTFLLFLMLSTMSLWAFAFFELPLTTPEWILRAQNACFGSALNGLPDAGGWLVLIGSPLLFLIAIHIMYWEEIIPAIKNSLSSMVFKILFSAISIVAVVQMTWIADRVLKLEVPSINFDQVGEPFPTNYPRLLTPTPNFNLINQHGISIDSSKIKKPYFISFLFAHCTTVCPTLLRTVEEASKSFASDEIDVIYITLDPWRDTPSSLTGLAQQWRVPFLHHILSGDPTNVNNVLDQFNVGRKRDEKNGEVVHPALTYIVNSRSNIVYALNNAPVEWLIEGMKRVLKEPY